jgi:hypothetical protein
LAFSRQIGRLQEQLLTLADGKSRSAEDSKMVSL